VTKGWKAGNTPRNGPGWVKQVFRLPDTKKGKTQWVRFDHHGKLPETARHEMMLNTDLCLMYTNPQGQPVAAALDDCCTWTPPELVESSTFQQIMRNSDGAYCGTSVRQRFEDNERACCHDTNWQICTKDRRSFGGPAQNDILEFAADEGAWRQVFLASWKKATENGHGSIQPLGPCQR